MRQIIEKGVGECFGNEGFRRIASQILENRLIDKRSDKESVKSLQIIVLQSIMKRMKRNGVESKLYYSLIFQDTVNIRNFSKIVPYLRWRQRFLQWIRRKITRDRIWKVYRELRTDPHIVFWALKQNPNSSRLWIHIEIGRHSLLIYADYMCIAEIQHPENNEFDTFWAGKFARMVLSKRHRLVNLRWNGEGKWEFGEMRDEVNRIIDSLEPSIPADGWRETMETYPPIYIRNADVTLDRVIFSAQFKLACTDNLHRSPWGFLQSNQ